METKQTLLASSAISSNVETDDELDLDIRFGTATVSVAGCERSAGDSEDRTCLSCATDCRLCR